MTNAAGLVEPFCDRLSSLLRMTSCQHRKFIDFNVNVNRQPEQVTICSLDSVRVQD
jgi:hypothetical protein